MSQDGRFATDLSVQVVSVETVVQEVIVETVVQEVVVETVVRCIELRADESGPRAWVQPAARGREGRSVRQRAGAGREHPAGRDGRKASGQFAEWLSVSNYFLQ